MHRKRCQNDVFAIVAFSLLFVGYIVASLVALTNEDRDAYFGCIHNTTLSSLDPNGTFVTQSEFIGALGFSGGAIFSAPFIGLGIVFALPYVGAPFLGATLLLAPPTSALFGVMYVGETPLVGLPLIAVGVLSATANACFVGKWRRTVRGLATAGRVITAVPSAPIVGSALAVVLTMVCVSLAQMGLSLPFVGTCHPLLHPREQDGDADDDDTGNWSVATWAALLMPVCAFVFAWLLLLVAQIATATYTGATALAYFLHFRPSRLPTSLAATALRWAVFSDVGAHARRALVPTASPAPAACCAGTRAVSDGLWRDGTHAAGPAGGYMAMVEHVRGEAAAPESSASAPASTSAATALADALNAHDGSTAPHAQSSEALRRVLGGGGGGGGGDASVPGLLREGRIGAAQGELVARVVDRTASVHSEAPPAPAGTAARAEEVPGPARASVLPCCRRPPRAGRSAYAAAFAVGEAANPAAGVVSVVAGVGVAEATRRASLLSARTGLHRDAMEDGVLVGRLMALSAVQFGTAVGCVTFAVALDGLADNLAPSSQLYARVEGIALVIGASTALWSFYALRLVTRVLPASLIAGAVCRAIDADMLANGPRAALGTHADEPDEPSAWADAGAVPAPSPARTSLFKPRQRHAGDALDPALDGIAVPHGSSALERMMGSR